MMHYIDKKDSKDTYSATKDTKLLLFFKTLFIKESWKMCVALFPPKY